MRFAGRSLAWPILSVSVEASCGLPQRHNPLVALDAVARGTGSNRIGDKARGKMAVMPLDHAAVGVPQVLRHHQQRRAIHDGKRSPGMAQDVEADRGLDLAARARLSMRAGFLTSAAQRGASIFKMMDVSRHRSLDTLSGYVRDSEFFHNHASAGLL